MEKLLQNDLDNGASIWVIGDVHGHASALNELIEKLKLGKDDHIILLGDLIDRGPESYDVICLVKENANIHAIKGNHESMMIDGFDPDQIEIPKGDMAVWMYNGGDMTVLSYLQNNTDDAGLLNEWEFRRNVGRDLAWLYNLPDHIVLNQWRLVHAGYDPRKGDLDKQSCDILHWVRRPFHEAKSPIDEKRCVLFGHTPTMTLGKKQGEIWSSSIELVDGRPSSIGLDTCAYGGEKPTLTAMDIQTGRIVHQTVQPMSPDIAPECFEELVVPGLPRGLYRSQMPLSLYDDLGEKVLEYWLEKGITHVVCLQESQEMEKYTGLNLVEDCYPDYNLESLWCPTADHHGFENHDKLIQDAKKAHSLLQEGKKVVVHCHAGVGRTGTFIAAMLISKGFEIDDAIKRVRGASPRLRYAINKNQEGALKS